MNLFRWFRSKARRCDRCFVLLVPFSRHGINDPVITVSSLLPQLCRRSAECVTIKQKPTHFSEINPCAKETSSSRLVLFAHPSGSTLGFAVNTDSGGGEDSLTAQWWQIPSHRFERVVAHVCHGQRILSKKSWRSVFPLWVSYAVDIHALLVEARDREIWAGIAKATVDSIVKTSTVATLKEEIRLSYLRTMVQLRDSGIERDIVHILHFQKAMDGITSSEGN